MPRLITNPAIRKETSEMMALAVPAVIGQLAQMSLGVIDTIMAGNLSSKALAAISIGSNLFMSLLIFSLGLFMALNPLISQANGARRFNKLGEYLRQGLYLAVFMAIPTIFLLNNIEPIMQFIGIQPTVIPIVLGYLKAISFGVLSLNLFFVLRSVNEGLFSTKAIMYISIAAIPCNVALNYIFMYGYLGLPAMGAIGLGYATTIVWTLLFLVLLLYTILTPKYRHLVLFSHFYKPEWRVLKEIMHIGIPLSLTIGLEMLMFGAVGLLIGRYSISMIAAHQIAANFSSLVFMVPMGLSIAVSARVGYAVGRSSATDIQLAANLGLLFSVIFTVCATSITLLFATEIVKVYTQEFAVIEIAHKLLYMAAIFMICDGLQVTTAGALRGMKDTMVPMFMSGISYWLVGFPLGFFLAEIMKYEVLGYWIGFIGGLSTAALLLSYRLKLLFRRLKKITFEAV